MSTHNIYFHGVIRKYQHFLVAESVLSELVLSDWEDAYALTVCLYTISNKNLPQLQINTIL